jgi:hypothetical protein
MRLRKGAACAAAVLGLVLTTASTAQGQVVRFYAISDAVPGRFFNAATTAVDPLNPNRLLIGLHSGMDWTVWKNTDFRASSGAYSYSTAMDTINLSIRAPFGFYISRVTYSQRGIGTVARIGFAGGAGNWIIAGVPANLGTFGTNPTLSRTVDLSARRLTTVTMAVTINLSAYAAATSGAATLALTGADVTVQLLPLPLQ